MSKKKFLLIPAAFALLLFNIVGISANAITYTFELQNGTETITPESLISDCEAHGGSCENVIFFNYHRWSNFNYSDTYGQIKQHMRYAFMVYADDSMPIAVSENNGVYTIHRDAMFRYNQFGYTSYESDNGDYKDERGCGLEVPNWSNNTWCYTLVYDSNNNTLLVDGSDPFNGYDYTLTDFRFTLGDNVYDPDRAAINVSFTPALNTSITRSGITNGVPTTQNSFYMDIQNVGSFGVQYLMCVSEPGYTPSDFNSIANAFSKGGTNTVQFDDNLKFMYICQEDCYLNQVNGYLGICLSPWHLLPAGSSVHKEIAWNMLDLAPYHDYDVAVYVIRNDLDYASMIANEYSNGAIIPSGGNDIHNKAAYALDWTVTEVYRSTFSVTDPAVYDENSSVGGGVANNKDYNYSKNLSYIEGYYDTNGKFHAEEWDAYSNGLGYIGTNGWTNSDNSPFHRDNYLGGNKTTRQYQNVVNDTSGVFSFLNSIFGMLPTQILTIFNLALWSLLILMIVRRLH